MVGGLGTKTAAAIPISLTDVVAYLFVGGTTAVLSTMVFIGQNSLLEFIESHSVFSIIVLIVVGYIVGFFCRILGEGLLRLWVRAGQKGSISLTPEQQRAIARLVFPRESNIQWDHGNFESYLASAAIAALHFLPGGKQQLDRKTSFVNLHTTLAGGSTVVFFAVLIGAFTAGGLRQSLPFLGAAVVAAIVAAVMSRLILPELDSLSRVRAKLAVAGAAIADRSNDSD